MSVNVDHMERNALWVKSVKNPNEAARILACNVLDLVAELRHALADAAQKAGEYANWAKGRMYTDGNLHPFSRENLVE
jgi:hypothetical protein